MSAPRGTTTAWLACLLPVAGCLPENLGDGLDIVNETKRPLHFYSQVIEPDGGRFRVSMTDCSDSDLVVRTNGGAAFAELTESWCAGQTWTIVGRGHGTLTDR